MQITKDTAIAFLAVILLALGALSAAARTQAAISPQVLSAYGIMRMPDGEYMETGAGAGAGAGTQTKAKKAGGSGHVMPNGEYMQDSVGGGSETKSGGHTMPNGEYMEDSGGGHDAVPNDNTSYLKRKGAGNEHQQSH